MRVNDFVTGEDRECSFLMERSFILNQIYLVKSHFIENPTCMKKLLTLLFAALPFILRSQTEGDLFFRDTVHEIHFQFSQPGYWDSLAANKPQEIYMKCDVTIDGSLYPDAGVRFKGNSSYNNPSVKKPFKIDLEEFVDGQTHDGIKQLSLNNGFKDPTFLREKLMLDFLDAHAIPAPGATFARLYINDELWGLYTVVEDVGKTFLSQRFGNNGGNLFKGDPQGTLTWKGWDQNLYAGDYELKTNEAENDWSSLIALLNALNNTPSAQLPDSLATYLNLENWFSYWAAHNLFANLDSYLGPGHNYYLYQNEDTGLFEFITWDVNEAFGNFKMGLNLQQLKTLPFTYIPQPATQRPLMNRLLQDAAMKQLFANRLCHLLQDFTNEKLDARIDSLAALIRPHVYEDAKKFYSNTQFEQNIGQDLVTPGGPQGPFEIAGLKPFIAARKSSLLTQLAPFGCTATAVLEPKANEIEISPNPASERIFVRTDGQVIASFSLWSVDGKMRQTWEGTNGQRLVELKIDDLPAGIYALLITTGQGRNFIKKIVLAVE
ncbi:MAG: T9SS type A sorting domain-containing protein [Saprospiraceae bacterium]|nr:MAG: T9SS type A sorting domain-containing protein [Saprospiraceae bacterium]